MIILRDPALTKRIANPDIRSLVEQRFAQICAGAPYDYELHGYMLVVQPGDTVDALEEESGCAILHQYASFLVNSGRTLFEVQHILGHSDPKVTQRYSHLSSKSLQDAANSASVIIKGAMQPTT